MCPPPTARAPRAARSTNERASARARRSLHARSEKLDDRLENVFAHVEPQRHVSVTVVAVRAGLARQEHEALLDSGVPETPRRVSGLHRLGRRYAVGAAGEEERRNLDIREAVEDALSVEHQPSVR